MSFENKQEHLPGFPDIPTIGAEGILRNFVIYPYLDPKYIEVLEDRTRLTRLEGQFARIRNLPAQKITIGDQEIKDTFIKTRDGIAIKMKDDSYALAYKEAGHVIEGYIAEYKIGVGTNDCSAAKIYGCGDLLDDLRALEKEAAEKELF